MVYRLKRRGEVSARLNPCVSNACRFSGPGQPGKVRASCCCANAAPWITEPRTASPLPVERIRQPTLLIWGDADAISPLAVGRHLAARIADARLHVVPGGDHDVARTDANKVARLIADHLA